MTMMYENNKSMGKAQLRMHVNKDRNLTADAIGADSHKQKIYAILYHSAVVAIPNVLR